MIGGTALIATESILIVYQKHACGMFQITCYRIERAMAFETLQKNNWKNKNLIYKGLICAVDMHRKAMKYNAQWYAAPLQIQKMILFLLQRGTKAFTMNINGLFVGSLEGAATLLSTAVSYFTVLYSTQN
ncbi:uncharacterized protein LOC112461641 [Temnothorax curvispinosus]|uniref:Uncharacterized protein LOC112461641 n=1 Tax=Temnothorax curvispinosus TaxID=300111 RepID=A0A6J1QJW7_9HYME|nr:uncharacterized protein LOC112461641 [Temnothorax curvispinosus]